MRLLRERSGARVPSCFIAGEGTRQCAGQARVTMALFAAPRPVLTPCCSAFWGPDPPPPPTGRIATRWPMAAGSADAALLGVQGFSFCPVLSRHDAVIKGSFRSWSVAPSRAFQTLSPQQVKVMRPSGYK